MNRESVIGIANTAIAQRLSRDSVIKLQQVARQYGSSCNISAAIENWLGELEDTDFERFSSKAQTDEWFKDWLNRLPLLV
jgi:hypothetical protein